MISSSPCGHGTGPVGWPVGEPALWLKRTSEDTGNLRQRQAACPAVPYWPRPAPAAAHRDRSRNRQRSTTARQPGLPASSVVTRHHTHALCSASSSAGERGSPPPRCNGPSSARAAPAPARRGPEHERPERSTAPKTASRQPAPQTPDCLKDRQVIRRHPLPLHSGLRAQNPATTVSSRKPRTR